MLIFYRTVTNPSPDSEKFARIHQIAAQHITTHSGGSEPSSLMISDPSTHTIMSQALEKLSEPQAKE